MCGILWCFFSRSAVFYGSVSHFLAFRGQQLEFVFFGLPALALASSEESPPQRG